MSSSIVEFSLSNGNVSASSLSCTNCSRTCTEFILIGSLCIFPVILGTTFAVTVQLLPSFSVISTFVVGVRYL